MHESDEKFIQNFGWKSEEKRPVGRPKLRWKIILEWILGKFGGKLTGCIWHRIGTNGGVL
jgi:hypothetical protein